MRARLFVAAIVLALAAVAGWWWFYGRTSEVAVVSPTRGTAVEIVYATGAVEPVRWSKVTSLVRQRIVEICNCENKAVKRGDVLARLDDKEIRAHLHELRAREDFAKREVARTTELVGRGAATTQAHEKSLTELRQIQGLISVLEERVDQYTITSPMDGVVLRQDGEVGEIVEAGSILFRVGMPKPLEVEAEVNEEDIPRVHGRADSCCSAPMPFRAGASRARCARSRRWAIRSPRPIASGSTCPTIRRCASA